jgi:rhamnopyranosyl-N-acetylglucosaminyl-diphospho-decaprenol beta-1,3/1,4-galactofuranosyltransferase
MKVVAVVLTYNRLSLLKKCVESIQNQSYSPDLLIIVDNASTDGTAEWLKDQSFTSHTLTKNVGASGGFSECLKISYEHGADWIWLMDDDTITQNDTLELLMNQLNALAPYQQEVGFLCSDVRWIDGSPHAMNTTWLLEDKQILSNLPLRQHTDIPFIQFSTFVSILFSVKAMEKVGLPIKEYFIWNDDIEFTRRIIANGFAGIAVKESIAVHETPTNHFASIFTDTEYPSWKYSYGLRNEMFTKKIQQGASVFWMTWIYRMFVLPIRIILKRKDHRWAYIKVVWTTSIQALFFNPKIEYLSPAKWGVK